jgi:hypothetical protein
VEEKPVNDDDEESLSSLSNESGKYPLNIL